MERDKGPVEILCKEIDYRFDSMMESDLLFIQFVRGLVDEVRERRDMGISMKGILKGSGPSDASATVLDAAYAMLVPASRPEMIEAAAKVHQLSDKHNPEDAYPTDHLIDMLSSCASAIRFGFEKPCHSRHAAEASNHIWKHRYGIRLFDSFTSNWQKDWARAKLQEALLVLALKGERVADAAHCVVQSKTDTFKAGNGRKVGIEDDGGEKCWIVPFDQMSSLENALK